jgi:hypothetical protein
MDADQKRTWAAVAAAPATYYVTASDEERAIMRDWLTGLMRERTVNLTFDKADGVERTMPCTLAESVLPPVKNTETKTVKYNPDVCRVFDPDRQVWRSFRWDRLKRIEFTIG